MPDKIEIFVSYAHEDEDLRERLGRHLKFLERENLLILWHDRNISPGQNWEHEIHEHLEKSQIILLLISVDFMASDYCNNIEVKRAMERHEFGQARVIPIILRSAIWESAPFGKLQALPENGKPALKSNREATDKVFRQIAESIREIVNEIIAAQQTFIPSIQMLSLNLTSYKEQSLKQQTSTLPSSEILDINPSLENQVLIQPIRQPSQITSQKSKISEVTDKTVRQVTMKAQEFPSTMVAKQSTNIPLPQTILDSNTLHDVLLTLDYKEQVKIFRQFLAEATVGCFIIHGEPEHGQRWLLKRLMTLLPSSTVEEPPFKFAFHRRVGSKTADALWRELGRWVNPEKPPSSPQQIIQQVYSLWQHQTVIIILNDLNEVKEQYLEEFIKDFWQPLTNMALHMHSRLPYHYLLMFLIDDADCVDKWDISFANQIDQDWQPRIPIKLRRIARFTESMLSQWLNYQMTRLPSGIVVSDLLKGTGGIPELVLERICTACGHDWYERESVWMKY